MCTAATVITSFSLTRRRSLLSIVFMLGIEMKHLNNYYKNKNRVIITAATLLTLSTIIVIIMLSSMAITSVEATTTSNATTATTTTTPPSPGIELSPQPFYQERTTNATQTPINQTHIQLTYSGNGTLTLPNTTETINTTSNGTAIISFVTQSGQGQETITTEDGNETATATFYYIARLNPSTGEGKATAIAVIHTDSTGRLAPLNGTILEGINEIRPEETVVTLWKWEGGTTIQDSSVAPTQEQGYP